MSQSWFQRGWRNIRLLTAGMLVCVCVAAAPAPDESFLMFDETVVIPERGTVPGHYVLAAGHKFSFLPPNSWRAEANRSERTVTLICDIRGVVMLFRLGAKLELDAGQTLAEASRKAVQKRYPEAELTREFECCTGSGQGTAFELQRRFGGDLQLTTRVAMVPFENGMIEFELTAPAAQFEQHTAAFGCLLTSFRAEAWKNARK